MVTIVEEPVIIELKEPEEQEPATEEMPPPPEELLEPTPRKPGRPAGAKSKIPGKPRAPRTKKVAEVVAKDIAQDIAQDITKDITIEPTRHLPDSRPIPDNGNTNVNTNASRMLNLLAEHSRSRQNRKADLWKSWFR